MSSVGVNGTAFEYFEAGSGEPLLFVHGSASDYRTWQFQRDQFSRWFRTIVYSRRYHWPNEPISPGVDYAMTGHVDDLQTLLHTLDAVPAHLVGHSYGAFLCLLLALRDPRLVRSLVLAEPPAVTLFVSDPPKPVELLKLLVRRPRTALSIIKFGARGVSPAIAAVRRDDMEAAMRSFGTAVLGREAFQQLSEARRDQVRVNFIKAELLGSGFAPLDSARIRQLQLPVLLVNGEKSPALFHHLADRLQELLLDTERIEIPGASHIMHEDNVAAYNEAVLSFLKKHQPVEQ
jgi:pimeloyl-ACP methyl ester carboxylesterase